MSSHLLVAAIDFGTTFSSWGFSFKHEFDLEPTRITAKQWTGLQSTVSLKGPTTILIKPDGKTIDSFGFDAESKYAELAEDNEHKAWYFFKRFKMQLFDKIGLSRDFTIKDALGKPLQAKTIFSLSLRYLKDDLWNMAKKRLFEQHLRESDILWVLTVPAIWNDVAKQFMREAAEDAGIMRQNLMIALEPEAASLYCRHLPTAQSEDHVGKLQAGSTYLILDAGGGTVDITVHQITSNGSLKEIYKANGGDWGGTKVDQAFEEFLSEITGTGAIETLKKDTMEDYLDLMRTFEVKKRETEPTSQKQVTFKIPVSLINSKIRDTIAMPRYKEKIKLMGDKLRLHPSIMIGLFEKSLKNIVEHLKCIFANPVVKACDVILMVGGFSESHILQERIKDNFPAKKIVVPVDAGLAVLKGAVMFGHNPTLIAERVCRFTYGNESSHKESSRCSHPSTTVSVVNGKRRCNGIFVVHVRAGDVIKLGEEQPEQIFGPVVPLQTEIRFDIYGTKGVYPELVTEEGCVKLGSVTIPMPDTTGGLDRKVGVSFLFGGTEIEVKVRDKTKGTEKKLSVSFMG